MLTFRGVIEKRSTEEFSCVPYIISLFNCLLYTWYGFPVVSDKWENITLLTINGFGVLLETSFIAIYFWFAPRQKKRLVSFLVFAVLLVFLTTASISAFFIHDHPHRKALVGSVAVVASATMYSSPLVAIGRVVQTQSVEFMPFYLSLFSFFTSSLWMAYGFLGNDLFIASPNFVGVPMAFLQLVVYYTYRKKKEKAREYEEADVEQKVALLVKD
ncbi:bidirectional sugar transporter SWEET3b isoform X2 [Amborella trichopoda]|nr:bidirectional sugar transporter SWEET3b isoform X2 [Amborella trichopoda]|eukprot:XP_020527912.1 bidirectional sugar transporter SWEET3b isoform X2 [Amborella trichopoda]